jgi:ABC-2 type transport system permease protein
MRAFVADILKEILLLVRDWMGLIFLFFMPILLVLVMTLMQDVSLHKLRNEKVDIALIDLDKSIVGKAIVQGLDSSAVFTIHQTFHGDTMDLNMAQHLVEDGEFNFVLVIPPKATRHMKRIVTNEIRKQMPTLGSRALPIDKLPNVDIQIYFNPLIKATFRQAVRSSIYELISNIQTQFIFKAYTDVVSHLSGKPNDDDFPMDKIHVVENKLGSLTQQLIPNTSQHNVPAWTVFAIFFIVIPLSGQIISERDEGTLIRLKTVPPLFISHLVSRVLVYSSIAMLQAYVILLIGKFALPVLGLPLVEFSGHLFSLLIFSFIIGLTATSYGLLIAVFARTQHQAAIFGSVSIILLAAMGGVWVPYYLMPEGMQSLSVLSPLNWALGGYYKIILTGSSLLDISGEIVKLLMIATLSLFLAFYYEHSKKS